MFLQWQKCCSVAQQIYNFPNQISFEIDAGCTFIAIVKRMLCNLPTWVLFVLSILLVLYALERFLFLRSKKVRSRQFLDGIVALLKKKRYNEALTVCEESPGVVALMVKTVLVFRDKGPDELSNAINGIALQEIPLLERRLPSIQLIAKVAPMISFVGVVQILAKMLNGMVHTSTYFSSKTIISLMQQSMILISFGLLLNILGTLAYAFLYGQVKHLIYDTEWSSNEILYHMANTEENDGNVDKEV
ncbi:MAG: MotA/TolQ/ExbB proton channel family protein [Puniceicoccales bacterium]|jgi:biopolymer transport protein ExbB|nr:MotA/TolQ/ExbB proton channel family protein [Puniceicoccales bacterium]